MSLSTTHKIVGTVTSESKLSTIAIFNDVGGTTLLPHGVYRVCVERLWEDYETGGRGAGFLVDDADIALAREAGTTGFAGSPEIEARNASMIESDPRLARILTREFAPEKVYFAVRDFVADDDGS